jgi:hypothetical protein
VLEDFPQKTWSCVGGFTSKGEGERQILASLNQHIPLPSRTEEKMSTATLTGRSPPEDRPVVPPACLGPFGPDPDWFAKYWLEDKPSSRLTLIIGRAIRRGAEFATTVALAGGTELSRRIRSISRLIAQRGRSGAWIRRVAMRGP